MTIPLPVRQSDPDTSRTAAKAVVRRRATVRNAVYDTLTLDGPLTLDDLIYQYRFHATTFGWPPASESSIRTRCSELVRDGLVERVPDAEGTSVNGFRAKLWRVVA